MTTGPRADVLYETYSNDLKDIGEDAESYSSELAKDWVQYQRRSGLQVPRYLAGLALEVEERLFRNYKDIDEANWWVSHPKERFSETLPFIAGIRDARTLKVARARFENETVDTLGVATIAYSVRLLSEVMKVAARDPNGIREFIETHSLDPEINDALHVAVDHIIYRRAKYNPSLEASFSVVREASSEPARLAMVGALDSKVLKFALRNRSDGFVEGSELIQEFASSSVARETMLGYMAIRSSGAKPRSFYKVGYMPRITSDLKYERKVKNDQEAASRRRQENERRDQEYRRRREEAETRRREQRSPVLDRVSAAILRAPSGVFTTLNRIGRSELTRVIKAVDDLRASQPGITDRKIYLHFHALTQGIESDPLDLSTIKVLGLFLGGNVSKSAEFPF